MTRRDDDLLHEFVRNAKGDAEKAMPPIDWARIDDRLFQRIAAEKSRLEFERRKRVGWGVGVGLAAAAAATIWVAVPANRAVTAKNPTPLAAVPPTQGPSVGSIVAIDGAGDVKIDRQSAQNGSTLHQGQRIEVERARAVLERVEPSGIAYTFESGSRAVVKDALPTLVLALEAGAVEAQVQHIKTGDAFSVDVGQARVAVHGTHLRVAREGEFVTVDLNEGVISLGTVDGPREVFSAPIHAEFNSTRIRETLRVDREAAHVRVPVALRRWPELLSTSIVAGKEANPTKVPIARNSQLGTTGQDPELLPAPGPRDERLSPAPATEKEVESPKGVQPVDPTAAIRSAVLKCFAKGIRNSETGEVQVRLTTTLRIEPLPNGESRAYFNPPPPPETMACASAAAHSAKFADGLAHTITIEYTP